MQQHHTSIQHGQTVQDGTLATLALNAEKAGNQERLRVRKPLKWRDSFTCITVNVIQRAAEKQAFDNITMMAAACVIDYGYEMITKALKHRRGTQH